jgi:acetyl-CoA carboxylase carboxyl transferase subunit beta
LKNNAYVVPDEDYHVRIGSEEYFEVLFDENKYTELMLEWNQQIR